MKVKLLHTIRKFYDYKFTKDDKVAVRNKRTGSIRIYESIEEYVRDVSYTDVFIHYMTSHTWNKKKKNIRDRRNTTQDEDVWNNL